MDVNNESVSDFISRFAGSKFEWGEFDCAVFFSEIVKFITGKDYSYVIKGHWNNKREALKFSTKLQFSDFINKNLPHIAVAREEVKTGDLCVMVSGRMETVGLVFYESVVIVAENLGGIAVLALDNSGLNITKIVRLV